MDSPRFSEIRAEAPNYDALKSSHEALHTALDEAKDLEARLEVISRWERLRREVMTWQSMTHLRFNQDTRNQSYKEAREHCDELSPKLTDLETRMKRRLLGSAARPELEESLGSQAFDLWAADVATFDPVIQDDLVKESKLTAEYTELLASARLDFQGETCNLSNIVKYTTSADRQVRHDAEAVRWAWFAEHRERLDQIFSELVTLRTEIAKKLGYESFTELGYKRMSRIDYDREDVERFRAEVREHVVPLAQELRARQASDLGLDPLMVWDEAVHDLRGNPAPAGDHDWMLERATEMFDALGEEIGSFFRLMREKELLDLKSREGKAGGGFCTDFMSYGLPFVFANFNGTKGDVDVFTHECGHAFQMWSSYEGAELVEYMWPTIEACEIHSMSLEFLCGPQLERFFEEDAERYRRTHLKEALLFLPYGVAVDHFQHLIYAKPEASAEERHAMWREMVETYLPWRRYGDMPHLPECGRWQLQRHIYLMPFYYIDYTLAQTCALQFWLLSRQDFGEAMERYVALCKRGGRLPFQALARSAGLTSPFDAGCLAGVVAEARKSLLD